MKRTAKARKVESKKKKIEQYPVSSKNPEIVKSEEHVAADNADVRPKQVRESKIKCTSAETSANVEDTKFGVKMKGAKLLSGGCKLVGAHVSGAGGLENAPINAAAMGAKAFALFLRSQRTWTCKALQDSTADLFKAECEKQGFLPRSILPHGSYLLNCGAPNPEILRKSRDALTDELRRCEKLGLVLYNFHPGSTCGKITVEECLDRIAESIDEAHSKTKYIVTVVENMSRQGNTIGGDFKELRGIIDRVKDKERMGVCIDTCHAFAAGYDVSTSDGFEAMMKEFDAVVGRKYLKALHLNDSKGELGCHKDRHENIGKGFIGEGCFRRIMRDPRFDNLPLILETPYTDDEGYAKEVKLLKSFQKE